jgi:predicted ATPase
LSALQARGFAIVGDSARAIIHDRRQRSLSPRPSAGDFANDVLRMDIARYTQYAATAGTVFFDRCVLDALCMLDQVTPLNEAELSSWLSKYRYSPPVFILPPWEDIYSNDADIRRFGKAEGLQVIRLEDLEDPPKKPPDLFDAP